MSAKVTIAEVAKRAGVSTMTVSRVLNNTGPVKKETAERIRAIIAELNYQPNLVARSLSSKRSMMIGIIINRVKKVFFDNYIGQIGSGITDIVQERGYRVMFFPVETDREKTSAYLDIVRSHVIDGLIILRSKTDNPHIQMLADNEVPFMLVNHKKYKKNYNFIDTENIEGTKTAMRHLYTNGHRKIAFFAGSMDETNSIDRLKAYHTAVKELRLVVNEEWVRYAEFDKQKAFEEAGKLLQCTNRPTAILASDDYMAIGAMERLQKEGLRVPQDMAVIGFDDVELASYVKPSLTTIRQPLTELGRVAAENLLNMIAGTQKSPVHKFLKLELVKRNSG